MAALKNPFRPAPGSSIKVDPIRDSAAIARIKENLQSTPRDLCLFTLGINTAYRACELLSLSVGQVRDLAPGQQLEIKQRKTGKYRAITMNATTVRSIQGWVSSHSYGGDDSPLFASSRSTDAIGVSSLNHLVKKWCREADLKGNFGTHTLRKTWGYHQRVLRGTSIPLLMVAYGHSTQAQTLAYLGIQAEEIQELYELEL